MSINAHKVDCIDTTGAGDLFSAGFMYGLVTDESLERCGELGTLLASAVIEIVGPRMKVDKWSELRLKIDNIKSA